LLLSKCFIDLQSFFKKVVVKIEPKTLKVLLKYSITGIADVAQLARAADL
jgi:hypothetical protein